MYCSLPRSAFVFCLSAAARLLQLLQLHANWFAAVCAPHGLHVSHTPSSSSTSTSSTSSQSQSQFRLRPLLPGALGCCCCCCSCSFWCCFTLVFRPCSTYNTLHFPPPPPITPPLVWRCKYAISWPDFAMERRVCCHLT